MQLTRNSAHNANPAWPENGVLVGNDDDADRLYGGPGNDTFRVRDYGRPVRDLVDGGPGRDIAEMDRLDHVKGVERVLR